MTLPTEFEERANIVDTSTHSSRPPLRQFWRSNETNKVELKNGKVRIKIAGHHGYQKIKIEDIFKKIPKKCIRKAAASVFFKSVQASKKTSIRGKKNDRQQRKKSNANRRRELDRKKAKKRGTRRRRTAARA